MVLIAFILAAVLIIIDQLFKFLISHTVRIDGPVSFLGGHVTILYAENRGIALGMMQGMRWLFIILTGAIIVGMIFYLIKNRPKSKLLLLSCALILGGGIGNLIDRVLLGYVVDYIQLSFFSPICNFADYCVTSGTVLLVIYVLFFSGFIDKNDKIKLSKADE
ncbi:lipoprotein signal peptidase [Clostridia bacterium]|nr:lipoprotein signal peptidase [Clostridia bacterium]